jgi:hypothetical protein
MMQQKESFYTEKYKKSILFPEYLTIKQTNFKYNKELLDIMFFLKQKYQGTNLQVNQTPEKYKVDPFTYTVGGFQMSGKHFTHYNEDDGLTKEQTNILKLFKTDVLDVTIKDYLENLKSFCVNTDDKLLYKNWFVLYDKNSFQEIHTHGNTLFTSVYFVKTLKHKNSYEGNLVITDTKSDYFGLKTETIVPEEGVIVTFPGNYPHYVLPVMQDDIRAVIVNDMYISKL